MRRQLSLTCARYCVTARCAAGGQACATSRTSDRLRASAVDRQLDSIAEPALPRVGELGIVAASHRLHVIRLPWRQGSERPGQRSAPAGRIVAYAEAAIR